MVEINNDFSVISTQAERHRSSDSHDDFSRWLSDENNAENTSLEKNADRDVPDRLLVQLDTPVSEEAIVNQLAPDNALHLPQTENVINLTAITPDFSTLVLETPSSASETLAIWLLAQEPNQSLNAVNKLITDEKGAVDVLWQSIGSFKLQLSSLDSMSPAKTNFMIFNHQTEQISHHDVVPKGNGVSQVSPTNRGQLNLSAMASTALIGRKFSNNISAQTSTINMSILNSLSESIKVRSVRVTESQGKLTLWIRDYFTGDDKSTVQQNFSLTKMHINRVVTNGVTQWEKS